jgi:hypothetical protein
VANTINSSFTKKGNKNLGDVAHLRKWTYFYNEFNLNKHIPAYSYTSTREYLVPLSSKSHLNP